uniref:Uncharacterized protein n=1 Tax=Populus alba TaxID=43335 RepID=A0A4U5QZ27_POPAL|nr:hypothetical protein D5086_0000044190 [Populus alba]
MQTIQALTETLPSEEIGSYRDEILVTEASSSGSDTKKHICCITSVPEVPDYAQNARKHFNSKDFPQKETLVTESDHDDTEVMEASSVVAQNQRAISPPLNQSTKKFLIM